MVGIGSLVATAYGSAPGTPRAKPRKGPVGTHRAAFSWDRNSMWVESEPGDGKRAS